MSSFVVFALPRSRTAWAARFLTYGGWACGHDEIRHLRSFSDVDSWFSQPKVGTIETGASNWWRLLPEDCRIATIRREPEQVLESLARHGFDPALMDKPLARMNAKLDQIEHRLGALRVDYDELALPSGGAKLFQHCLALPFDQGWYEYWNKVNLQVDLGIILRYYQAHLPQLENLARQAKQKILRKLQRRATIEANGITIQQEGFESFFQDSQTLFARHLVEVGEAPNAFLEKNLELMRKLDSIGAMQITTARANGRVFGYLMALIAPSLERTDVTDALHLTFYADSAVPGLGLKLQRASANALRERGVDDLYLRAGVRGDGARMSTLYRRLGSENFGQLFKLALKEP